MRTRLWCLAGLAGVIAAASGLTSASAQDVNNLVRTLNAILNPADAQRLEDQARRGGRAEEERYWRDYRAGLEHRQPQREETHAPSYRDADRRNYEIGPDEARRFEEESRRRRRFEEERYWRDYRAGLERRPGGDRRDYRIGPDEARRFEEQSRRNHRIEEERYWRDYRAGLGRGQAPSGEYRGYRDQRERE